MSQIRWFTRRQGPFTCRYPAVTTSSHRRRGPVPGDRRSPLRLRNLVSRGTCHVTTFCCSTPRAPLRRHEPCTPPDNPSEDGSADRTRSDVQPPRPGTARCAARAQVPVRPKNWHPCRPYGDAFLPRSPPGFLPVGEGTQAGSTTREKRMTKASLQRDNRGCPWTS